ncbi:MAG: replicative DNA helicase [Firmicutes bacterium]|nr:replicative DNA helicase [Bacillota bacterium]
MPNNNTPKQKSIQDHPNVKGRILPHSLEAEQAVLGCVMIDEYAPIHVLNEIKPDDFYSPSHREIFSAMLSIAQNDKPVDIITLVTELEGLGSLEAAGGVSYLTALSDAVPSASNYKHYTAIVKKNSVLRKLIEAAQAITDKAFTGDPDDNALQFSEAEIFALSEKFDRSKLVPVGGALTEAIQRMEFMFKNPDANRGIPTGFRRLDRILNGFQGGDLVLVAARPGQGKTSIGMNFITHAAFDGNRRTKAGKADPYKCAVFSLEMPAVQLSKRLLCSTATVNMAHANSGELSGPEWKKIYSAKSRLDKVHLYIDDSSLSTPIEILSKCRRLKREKGLDLVMIDYLQLMSSGKRVENRQQEVSDITRTLKIAAKELNVPILLLSQLNREVEKRKGGEPQMSDLRESGAIEQDADIILFIHRKYGPTDQSVDEETRNMVQLIIAKHRNGELGTVDVRWRGDFVTFEDVDTAGYLGKAVPPGGGERESFVMSADDAGVRGQGAGGRDADDADHDFPSAPPNQITDETKNEKRKTKNEGRDSSLQPVGDDPSDAPWEPNSVGDDALIVPFRSNNDDGGSFSGRTAEEIMKVPLKMNDEEDIF